MPSDKDPKRRFNMSFNEARLPSDKAKTIRRTKSGRTEERSASRSLSPIIIRNAISPMISPVINGLRRLSRPSEPPSTPSSKKERSRVKGEKVEGSFVGMDEGSSSFGGATNPTHAETGSFNGSGTVSADTGKRNDKDKHESFASLGSASLDAFELFDQKQSQRSDIPFQRPDMRTLLAPSGRDLDANNEESETMVETRRRSRSEKKSKRISSKPPKPASFSTARDKPLTGGSDEQKPASFSSNKPPSGRAVRSGGKKSSPTMPAKHLSTPGERSTKATVPTDPPNRKSDDRPNEGDGRGSHRMSEGGARLSSASPKPHKPRMSEATTASTSQVLASPKLHKPTHTSEVTPGTPHKPRMSEATASQVLPSPKLHKPTHMSEVTPGGASPSSPSRRTHRVSEGSSRQAPPSPDRLKHRSSDPSPARHTSVSPSRRTPRLSEGNTREPSASPKRHRHTSRGDSAVNGGQTSVASSNQQQSAKALGEDELLSYLGLSSLPPPGHGRDQGRTNSTPNSNRPERARSASRESSASTRRHRGRDHKSTGQSGDNANATDKSPSGQPGDHGSKPHSRDRSKKPSRRSLSRSKDERGEHANTSPRVSRSKSDKQEYSSHRRRSSHPTGEGQHQSRSQLRDNSKSRSDRLIDEENENRKSYRRGKRSSQHPRVTTVTITADNDRKEDGETEKPVSGRSIGLDDPTEKSSSDFQSAAERSNLAKETLANVRDIKEDLKQMRARRKTFLDSPLKAKAESAVQLPNVKFPLPIRSPAVTRTRHVASPMLANGPMHQSLSALTVSKMSLNSSSISDLKYSVGAISLDDLDVGFFNKSLPVLPPIVTAEDVRIEELKNELQETMELIKDTTHKVRKEREEITDYQRKNWSIRKSLMQNQGPSDSVTSLNLKIERLLRQQRELDLETDQLRDQKDAIGETCSEITHRIEDTKALFDILTQVVVPLLPSAEMPRGKEVSASSKMIMSFGASPSRRTVPSVASIENEDDSIISVEVGLAGSFDTVKKS